MNAVLEPITRLSKDLKEASKVLSKDEARFLVNAYYLMQEQRIRSGNQIRIMSVNNEPHDVLAWLNNQSESLENQIKLALGKFAENDPVGQWMLSIHGIGPVISAGLLAHLSVNPWRCQRPVEERVGTPRCTERSPCGAEGCGYKPIETAGAWWRFAGLDPTLKWEKGKRRPWNAKLKVLCWKLGESFVKVSGNSEAYYGRIYAERKVLEVQRNSEGLFKEQAAKSLTEKNFGRDTKARKAYEQGKLPDARLHLRAERYAVKLFLSHLHDVWYRHEFHKAPPMPYAIAYLQHAHYLPPPNVEVDVGDVDVGDDDISDGLLE